MLASVNTAASISRAILLRPGLYLIARWNWKSALLSAVFRAALFLRATFRASPTLTFSASLVALSASLVEFVLAFALAGFGGAFAQAYRRARPNWLAFGASFLPAALWHTSDLLLHALRHTPRMPVSTAISIGYSIAATAATLALMRKGVLLVGEDSDLGLADTQRAARGRRMWGAER
ncbi:MAG: hypothetical protein ABSB35_03360 [Bryobacteraceae bacterium]|jgi:hypothetical protein